jgi:hypothetical protein
VVGIESVVLEQPIFCFITNDMFQFLWTADEPEEPGPTVTNNDEQETVKEAQAQAVAEEPISTCTPLGPPQTWNQAHLEYCRQHSLLVATPKQILQSLPDGEEVAWTLPKVEQAVVVSTGDKQGMLQAILQQEKVQESTTCDTSSSSSSSYRIWSRVYGAVSSVVRKMNDDDDDDLSEHVEWNQAGDDALGDEQAQQRGIVDWKDPILCLELMTPCWHSLQTRLAREIDPSSPHLLGRSEWKDWLGQDGEGDSMLFSLSQKDADLLLDLLIINQQAKLVSRNGKPELIALGAVVDDNNALDAAVTIWDLNLAMQSTERRLEEWAVQVQECEKKALQCKQQGQPKLALYQMGRRKLIQRQMDSSAQILLKLEQTKLAVWQAQSNTSLVATLRSATKTLQELRTSTPLEQVVEDVQDNLQEELDGLSELQSSLVCQDQDGDDEALLQELADLTFEDSKQEESLDELALSLPVAPTGMSIGDELGTKEAAEESA